MKAHSLDKTEIYFENTGSGQPALIFVHGWMGSSRWWDSQREHFSSRHLVVQLDLAGHGNSGKGRSEWSAANYAEDIKSVVRALDAEKVVLVGHSMAGAYALEAATSLKNVAAVVLVDTLKNLDQLLSLQQAENLFEMYQQDFRVAIEKILAPHLFAKTSPPEIVARLCREFAEKPVDFAVSALRPLYEMDIRQLAKRVSVPVRAINSDMHPTDAVTNRKYFSDFDFLVLPGVGHYPMLENPTQFNALLEKLLKELRL